MIMAAAVQPDWQAFWDRDIALYSGVKVFSSQDAFKEGLYRPIESYEIATKSKFVKGWCSNGHGSKSKFGTFVQGKLAQQMHCRVVNVLARLIYVAGPRAPPLGVGQSSVSTFKGILGMLEI
jgi:hypothetical protein